MRALRGSLLVVCLAVGGWLLLSSVAAHGEPAELRGEWTLAPSAVPENVEFSLRSSDAGMDSSSTWAKDQFQGMDWSPIAKHDVQFTVARDAGQLDCGGMLRQGSGGGWFVFRANSHYSDEMEQLGFSGIAGNWQLLLAIEDVRLDFTRDLRAQGVEGLDLGKLIAFRVHGVTPEFVRALGRLGYKHLHADTLIALRVHGAGPEYIEGLQAHGLHNLRLDQVIALRIQDVN